MPTPVGPPPPDPNDPDLCDWGDEDEDLPRRRHPWRAVLVVIIVVSLMLLLLVSVL